MSGCVVDSDSVELTVDGGVLSADVKVSEESGNQFQILSDGVFSSGAPTGAVVFFTVDSPPSGWLICDGSTVSRATYATLFDVIGTTFGAGNGTTTFNLPDMQGRAAVSLGEHASVAAIGDNEGVALANRSPKHNSFVSDPEHAHGIGSGVASNPGTGGVPGATGNPPTETLVTDAASTGITVGPGGTLPVDTPAYLVLVAIIKT